MTGLDLDFVRSQFPAFGEPSLAGFAHFENAGGSYACRQTIEWLDRYYRRTKLQPYYNSAPSRTAGAQMDAAKQRLAAWLNVGADELQFGPSTSQNTYVIAQALREHLQPGDEIVVTNQDHEANIGVWRRLESAGMVVREWRIDPESAARSPTSCTGPVRSPSWMAWRSLRTDCRTWPRWAWTSTCYRSTRCMARIWVPCTCAAI
jgi:selenocysteine lyase/cysteine desulfurase